MALMLRCVGMFSGEFTRALLPPFFWYGKSVIAILLGVFSLIFAIAWITLLIIATAIDK